MTLKIVRTHECPGFRIAEIEGTHEQNHASWWTFQDEQVVRDRHWHPRPGEVVLDVGAAFGSYALPALAAGARVVAFNPAPFDAELFDLNLSLNPELAKRCLHVRDGIHERDGWFDPDENRFYAFGLGIAHQGFLQVRSLDSWLAERPGIDRVDWIKLDVEGAELGALRGAEQCLQKWRPKILVECHNFHVVTMEADVAAHVVGLGLGYHVESHPHHAVSHSFFWVP